jgi:hypothetical protein
MNINFYWSGNDFQFLNNLVIKSHIIVGHKPVIWLQGNTPESPYWIGGLPEVEIRNADDIWESVGYLKEGVDVRTTSDLWSYHMMKQTGEYYSDTDAFALLPWPDQEILLATYDPQVINVGVMRLPKNHPVLDCCIKTHKKSWGNVWLFTKCVRDHGLDYNVPIEAFYPVHCGNNSSKVMGCRGKLFDNYNEIKEKFFKNTIIHSYHYWSNKVSIEGCDHTWLDKPELQGSLFVWLNNWINDNY